MSAQQKQQQPFWLLVNYVKRADTVQSSPFLPKFPSFFLQAAESGVFSKVRVCEAERSNESPSGGLLSDRTVLHSKMEGPRPDKFTLTQLDFCGNLSQQLNITYFYIIKSIRILYMTKPLKAELLAWLEKLKQDEQNAPEKYSNCGQLFRLADGLPIAPELLTKWYRQWRSAHLEFDQIVFHGLRHSSATYQLLQSDGDFKSVQGNTGHATASVLMDTYAHTQDKPRLELTEKIEANFYSQDLTPAAPQPRQNEKPAATKISGKEILEAIRLMDADERRELTRALFA